MNTTTEKNESCFANATTVKLPSMVETAKVGAAWGAGVAVGVTGASIAMSGAVSLGRFAQKKLFPTRTQKIARLFGR